MEAAEGMAKPSSAVLRWKNLSSNNGLIVSVCNCRMRRTWPNIRIDVSPTWISIVWIGVASADKPQRRKLVSAFPLRRCGVWEVASPLRTEEIYASPASSLIHGHVLDILQLRTHIVRSLMLLLSAPPVIAALGTTAFPSAASIDYSKNKEIMMAQDFLVFFVILLLDFS